LLVGLSAPTVTISTAEGDELQIEIKTRELLSLELWKGDVFEFSENCVYFVCTVITDTNLLST
jgi:hypothetical protein